MGLKERKKDLEDTLRCLNEDLEATQKAIRSVQGSLEEIRKEISDSEKKLQVTDHAILRFLQRRGIVNIDKLRSVMQAEVNRQMESRTAQFKKNCHSAKTVISGRFSVGENLYAIVENKKVITVVPGSTAGLKEDKNVECSASEGIVKED